MNLPNRLPILSDPDAGLGEMMAVMQQQNFHRRRAMLRALGALGGLGGAAMLAPSKALAACTVIPAETAGPYPGDGTNGPNVLTQSGIVRSDIRSSFGTASAVAGGTLLTVTLQLVNTNGSCASLAGYAVYLWHCDAAGNYSLYSNGVTTQNYLRGVQVSDASGLVTFTTIFPGCYSGRWPHIHFEVYNSVGQAVSGRNAVATSQLALPEAVSRQVYAQTALYPSSTNNLNQLTLATDNVFSDDRAVNQLASVSGSVAAGYLATLTVGVAGAAVSAPADYADMWWAGSSENGWGVSITQHGTVQFIVLYVYDGSGNPVWYAMPGGAWNAANTAYTGALYLPTSAPYTAYDASQFRAGGATNASVGTATITYTSTSTATLTYTINGVSGTKTLTRQVFATGTRTVLAVNDLWWNPSENGWGLNIAQQANMLFPVWYTYGSDGKAKWFGVPGGTWSGNTFTGTIYAASGAQWVGVVYDAARFAATAVGTMVLAFSDANNAVMTYTVNGVTQTKNIVRQVF